MAATKIKPGRAKINAKFWTESMSMEVSGAFMPESTALNVYRMVSGTMPKARIDLLNERMRQIDPEGENRSLAEDDLHKSDQLVEAARCYVDFVLLNDPNEDEVPVMWPWAPESYKPKDRRSNLVRAAALLVAEIERMDRDQQPKDA